MHSQKSQPPKAKKPSGKKGVLSKKRARRNYFVLEFEKIDKKKNARDLI